MSFTDAPVNEAPAKPSTCTLPNVRLPPADTLVAPAPELVALTVRDAGADICTVPLPTAVTAGVPAPEPTLTVTFVPVTVVLFVLIRSARIVPAVTFSVLACIVPVATEENALVELPLTTRLLVTIVLLPVEPIVVVPVGLLIVKLPAI